MQAVVQITEIHIATYRAIRDYIYHNRKSPDLITIEDMCGVHNRNEILDILKDLKSLGYLLFDGPQVQNIHILN